jgi:DNA-binding HxlR family transcriptional regulator
MAIEESDAELLTMFKALADESRLKIIGLLATRERSVDELATTLKLKPPTVSHHLATLREIGLVEMRAAGTTHVYNFLPDTLRRLNRRLAPEKLAIPDDAVGDEWERKVLADFTEQGRLKAIPAGERKRLVILKWFARKFQPGTRYTELQVNAIIAEFINDYASIRRYLVDNRLMERRSSIYWRVDTAE